MRVSIFILIFLLLTLSFWNCGDTTTTDEDQETGPPAVPKIHPHNPDIPDDEWGPDALTDTDGIYIEWDANTEEDLAGYKIYRSINADDGYKLIDTLSKAEVFYEDNDVSVGSRYYYRILAYDEDGNESRMSERASYMLLPKPALIKPSNQSEINTTSPAFTWLGVSEAQSYVVHVYVNTEDKEVSWQVVWKSSEKFPFETLAMSYNEDDKAAQPLEDGKRYRCRVDAIGGEGVGSESTWRYFTVKL